MDSLNIDSFGVRRKDTTRGPPLRVLSLDGGGVRGYSIMIILQELMHRTFVETHGRAPRREEIPKPCEHFDLIVGTGTGGLIALMLGRLRMSLETSKDVYVRMTKRVFETDKTIAGIPYRSTLFKASKLEEAIRDCVREHTVYDDEGNDDKKQGNGPAKQQRSMSTTSRYSQIGSAPNTDVRTQAMAVRYGKPNALLYDSREARTKTAVTAVYRGTRKDGSAILLRSYDSRAETAIEPKCTVWQAGRATSATALAFKPIQIGQSVFLDEGAGKYNPSPLALDEALLNEWPGREIGVFVSIGTGKRPANTDAQQHLWWEGFVSSGVGDFAEARRRLIAKIEGCEEIHQYMLKKHLIDRGVDPANYYRLNVPAGVGEFGMNEWNRLAEISTNTRRYLAEQRIQQMNVGCAVKIAKIHLATQRWQRAANGEPFDNRNARLSWEYDDASAAAAAPPPPPKPLLHPDAIELPGEDAPSSRPGSGYYQHQHHQQQYDPLPNSPRIPSVVVSPQSNRTSWTGQGSLQDANDKYPVTPEDQQQQHPYRRSHDIPRPLRTQVSQASLPLRPNSDYYHQQQQPIPSVGGGAGHVESHPPPRPPKTPIQGMSAQPVGSQHQHQQQPPPQVPTVAVSAPSPSPGPLPYPMEDGPPPVVNLARKPELERG